VLKGSGFSLEDVRAAGGIVQVPTTMMQYKKWEKGLLRGDGEPGFQTPTGKFEIASTILQEHGYDPCLCTLSPEKGPWRSRNWRRVFPWCLTPGRGLPTISDPSFTAFPASSRIAPNRRS
jgi:hypothetical protein